MVREGEEEQSPSSAMPLVVMTGLPSSGKSRVAGHLATWFEGQGRQVEVVGEEHLLGEFTKDQVFSDSQKEKAVRGRLKSEVIRLLSREGVIICDGLNYIKGFRYELYCASKAAKSSQCTVHCDLSVQDCEAWNGGREEGRWEGEVLAALAMRYEAPVHSNRWDAPLHLVLRDGQVDCQAISDSLFLAKAVKPNLSTQNAPLAGTDFVHQLDLQCQAVVQAILASQAAGTPPGTSIAVPGTAERVQLNRNYTLAELARTKRQFHVYSRQTPCTDLPRLATMFVQYINANLTE